MKIKPIIGIVSKHIEVDNKRQDGLIRDEVKNAIFDNGGIAIGILSPDREVNFVPDGQDSWSAYLTQKQKDEIISQIKLCDGIILQGGKDSDKYESWIAKYTFEHDIPTLGICAGQNAMIRGLGGTTKKVQNTAKHSQMWVEEVHPIFINKESKFYEIVKCDMMMVNSRHKKTIDNPTSNYKIAAVCDDGYYDVLEAPNKKFNIAVRFHPESLYRTHEEHNAIFKALIKACRK